jgi:hypothetical protein
VETKDWEATIEVDRNDIEDDQLGFYNPIVAALAEEARKHPEKLISDLMIGGFSTACYDGQNFFSTAHPVGAGTVSNFGGGAGTAWYLLDTSRMVKPFIFQLRRDVQLVRMDRQDDEHAFMRKKMRYGVDYRGAAAYGLWQMAYACKETLNDTNYAAARAAIPDLVVTTDLIAGFPGETEVDFEQGLAFVSDCRFAHAHVFPFSAREGTAAARFADQAPAAVVRERMQRLQAAVAVTGAAERRRFLATTRPVLWEGQGRPLVDEPGWLWSGLTDNYLRVHAVALAGVDLHNQIVPALLDTLQGEVLWGALSS